MCIAGKYIVRFYKVKQIVLEFSPSYGRLTALFAMTAEKKKIMLLGGLRYLLPVIRTAHKLGLHVITCDYLPDNIAHRYSDEYHNVSIIDKEAVLKLAQELRIDGIMSFAVDPGVVTAAYVAEKMGLPNVGPYESVCILQDKARFREFLRAHQFNCPWSYGFDSVEDAMAAVSQFSWPAIVKPTDSAGSKGVSRVNNNAELLPALRFAMESSLGGHIIVEEYIEKVGDTTGSDSFSIDGKFEFYSFDNQHFDSNSINPFTPSAHSWHSTMSAERQQILKRELQRLITLLGMKTSIFNVEARVGVDGKVYIMEVSPRGGGNRLAEVIQLATGVPLIENAVRASVGMPLLDMQDSHYQDNWLLLMIHSDRDGEFNELHIHPHYQKYIVEQDLWVSSGDKVRAFRGANDAIGTLILKCDTMEQVEFACSNASEIVRVITT